MTLNRIYQHGHPDHRQDVELLPLEHGLRVQFINQDGEDTLVALLGFPM